MEKKTPTKRKKDSEKDNEEKKDEEEEIEDQEEDSKKGKTKKDGKKKSSRKKSKSKSKSNSKSKSKNKSRSRSESKSKSKSKEKEKSKEKTKEKAKTKDTVKQPTLESFGIKTDKEDPLSKQYPPFPDDDESKLLKIVHWNINGLRPLLKKRELDNLISEEDPDIICFNETKIDNELIEKMNYRSLFNKTYKSYWYCPTEKKGYSGTAIFTKYEPLSVKYGIGIDKHDEEGRVITIEFKKFFLISCYTPNAGDGLKRIDYRVNEWDSDFFEYINSLKEKKDIILTGDLNVAKEDIDIFEPKGHEKSPGFTKLEKDSFMKFLEMGYVDTFRDLHPDEQKFSFFSKRGGKMKEDNKGWRLDYFVINEEPKYIVVKESDMLDKDLYDSSDHIPIVFCFNLKK